MTLNPYEAPQTINEPLPIATAQDSFVRTREGLIRATGFCVEGGRVQFAAGLLGILALLFGFQRDDFFDMEEHLGKLMFLSCSVATCVLWTWGATKNLRGYTGLAEYVTNERIQNVYAVNQIHWWVQFAALVLLLFVAVGMRGDREYFTAAVLALITLSYCHAILLQSIAFRYWAVRLDLPTAGRGYFAGGIVVAGLLAAELTLLLWVARVPVVLHLVLSFVLAITAWDFAQRYHAIRADLLEPRDS